jgi:hypothetical protein
VSLLRLLRPRAGVLSLTFSGTTGRLTTFANTAAGITTNMNQEWLWCVGSSDFLDSF